jgi:hypothetical protein
MVLLLAALSTGCMAPNVRTLNNHTVIGGSVIQTKRGYVVYPAPQFKVVFNNFSNHHMEVRRDGNVICQVPNGGSHVISFVCEPTGNQMNLLFALYDKQGEKSIVSRVYSEVLVTNYGSNTYAFGSYEAGRTLGKVRVMAYTVTPTGTSRDGTGWY